MAENRRILIATGGTGGHIYPAIQTAEELRRRGWKILFIGAFGPSGPDKLGARGFAHVDMRIKGFVSKGLWQKFLAAVCLLTAFWGCVAQVLRFKPGVVLGFGGYSSVPAVIAGRMLGVRTMIHEQNVRPGEANKFLGRMVDKVAVTFKDTLAAFSKARVVWTGCPVRPMASSRSRGQVLRELGLEGTRRTVLVFGGSQGSRAINGCAVSFFEQEGLSRGLQVIHLCGRGAAEELRARYARSGAPFYVKEYMEHIEDAYAVADVVIARAGAGTVTELGLLGIPAILIPYPFAQSHQEANAGVLARHSAAVIIQEKDLNPLMLGDKIFLMFAQDSSREAIRSQLTEDIVPDAGVRLADEVGRL